ncbi:YafY family protein [Nocardiopsis sp. RV163]|uniref:helix-turn-helix transcriptional regulator n=1 Tax=Nocardiopsis sp. RV163 TaxID=1661388 RepID=UPI000A58EB28|nr:WYL domain-containing protein [Nocardiopsis sp. RV163]
MVMKASARLLALLSVLQTRRDWSGRDLAARLDVSARTVRRDVDRLRELGYPITTFKGPDGGYRLDAGSRMPPLLFDDDQAVALAVALQAATASGAGTGEAAARALNTVRQVMPARLRQRIDAVRVAVVAPPAVPRARADGGVLREISAAVHAREELRLDYATAFRSCFREEADAVGPRRVQPHHLVTWAGRWYLLGWDVEREDWRTLRVDRIGVRSPNGPRFTPREVPGGDVASFLIGRFRGSDGAVDWPCLGEVILDLPASAAAPFAHDGLVEEVGPERCRLVLGSWSWVGLASAVGRFDADFEVVGPPELEDAFARLARRCAGGGRQARAPER